MKPRDATDLIALAAIWGASFLFMRLGASDFGPVALSAVRVAGAALFLLPLLVMRGLWSTLRAHAVPIFMVGLINSAIPFVLFSAAALAIPAGLSAIFNAASPLFAALIARLWLGERLDVSRVAGLVIGFAGVAALAASKASFQPGASAAGWAVLACIGAAVMYGLGANYTKRRLGGVAPLAVAAGSQLSATVLLAVPAWIWWPAVTPSAVAWGTAALLAVLCTGVAYILYFRLIANVGPANAITVTFLIPAFAVIWGYAILDEGVTLAMLAGCAVILLGTAMAIGLLRLPRRGAPVKP